MPSPELKMHLFIGSHFSLNPWMADNVSEFEALGGILLHHACDEVHEFIAEAFLFLESRFHIPELVGLVVDEPFVANVLFFSFCEGRLASVHEEKDDGG